MESRLKLIYLAWPVGFFLGLHGACLAVFRSNPTSLATYPFLILAPSFALAACLWRTKISAPHARLFWILFSLGLTFWNCGMLLSAWENLFKRTPFPVTFLSDFVYFLYGVPILLAISSSTESERLRLCIWIDGIQATLTAYLTYVTIFSVAPFTARTIHPISDALLSITYDMENLILAITATLRLLAQPQETEERHFYKVLCGFLWVYAIFAAINNHFSVISEGHSLDILVDVPFLFLALATISLPLQEKESAPIALKKPLALCIENSSPILYSLALSALGLMVVRQHFYVGLTAIILALTVYGIRVITLQVRYIHSQQALRQACDLMEEISLQDSLTKVANRRCFDQVLSSEWNRAIRMKHPLSLLLIDIDHFKHLNDGYGHQHGDKCLADIAAAMQSVFKRSGDLLARYGGEEFAVILPGTGASGAQDVAAILRDAIRSLKIPTEANSLGIVTVSVGIGTFERPESGTPWALIKASDSALYEAKRKGRDRIECAFL
jgi:diguanylate cyclase (GGDEF)-like protein